jgi:Bacterial CdiA-CT RNAse A domain
MGRMTRLSGQRTSVRLVLALGLGALVSCQPPAATTGTDTTAPAMTAHAESRLNTGPSRDLAQDERAGGHILRKHVGQTEEDLRRRLERERNITGASTYTDRPTAEHVVGAAIAKSQDRIQNWLSRSGGHPNLVLDYDGDEAIGRTMNRGEHNSRPCTHALVVLKYAGPNNYYVLTSYPECR